MESQVRIVEVGLRDGLQNEKTMVSLDNRQQILSKLIAAGLNSIEAGSFVSPKWVPAMADSEALFAWYNSEITKGHFSKSLALSALIPNEKGMEAALRLSVKEVAIFAACSETFSQKNTNCSIDESFDRLEKVTKIALKEGIRVRGYLSTCFGCPFEGAVDAEVVHSNVKRMKNLGVYEVSLGDTIGLAGAGDVEFLLNRLFLDIEPLFLAGHFHDTRGQGVANVLRAYQLGLRAFDASIGGLGGCPYAPGATGNVATEDLVFLFNSMKIRTGIQLESLLDLNEWLSGIMGRQLPSKVGRAAHQGYVPHKGCFL